MLTMHNGFHHKGDADLLYLLKNECDRRLIGFQDTMETAILGLRNYVRNGKERLLNASSTVEDD